MPYQNSILIAAAGAGKTTRIVKEALEASKTSRVLITTFTLNNVAEIKKAICREVGIVPTNVVVMPWFTFVLRELARPYQNQFYRPRRIRSLNLVNGRSDPYAPKADKDRYFFGRGTNVYSDKLSELALMCNESSEGKVLARLEDYVDHIFIDEVQDLAGYDLDILKLFLGAEFYLTMVGDYRQATLATNQSPKHKKYRYAGIIKLFQDWDEKGLCTLDYATTSYRCISSLCAFSDLVFPEAPKTVSANEKETDHDGIFLVRKKEVPAYIDSYQPQVLRHSKSNKCQGYLAMNFGISKGLTFKRCLIFPTAKIEKYLETGDPSKLSDKELFYVSVTRAQQSVAFVHDGETAIPGVRRFEP